MAMINMKQKPEREESPGEIEYEEPMYPYGLCLHLDQDQLEKLGITALPKVGGEMMITAKCGVKSVSSNQMQGGDAESRVCLQITDMDVGQTDNAQNNDRATKLYGNTNGGTEGRAINNLQSSLLGG